MTQKERMERRPSTVRQSSPDSTYCLPLASVRVISMVFPVALVSVIWKLTMSAEAPTFSASSSPVKVTVQL